MEDKGFEKYYADSTFLKNQHLFLGGPRLHPPKTNKVEKEIDIC